MPPWNDTHYARAQAFIGLLADALAAPAPSSAAPAPSAPAAPPTGGTTAAHVFKKIPWKK